MENASKALIIAGEMLLGIMVLSLLVYFFSRAANFSHTYQSIKDDEEIAQFNSNFEKYMKTGVSYNIRDIVTVINFARNYNSKQNLPADYIKVCINSIDYANIDDTSKTDEEIIKLLSDYSEETKNENGKITHTVYTIESNAYFPAGLISEIKYKSETKTE